MPPEFLAGFSRTGSDTAASRSSAASMGEGVTIDSQWFQSTAAVGDSPASKESPAKLSRTPSLVAAISPNRPASPLEPFAKRRSPPRGRSPIKADPSPAKAPVSSSSPSQMVKLSESVLPEMVISNLSHPSETSISKLTSPAVDHTIPARPSTSTIPRGNRQRTETPPNIKRHSQEESMGLSSQLRGSSNAGQSIEAIEASETCAISRHNQNIPRAAAQPLRSRNHEDGNGDLCGGGSASMNGGRDRAQQYRALSRKTIVSRALEKANTAVRLDNVCNLEGAIAAYTDACELLQQVTLHSGGDDEKQKLEEIVS